MLAATLMLALAARAAATTGDSSGDIFKQGALAAPNAVSLHLPPLLHPALAGQDRTDLALLEPKSEHLSHWYRADIDTALVANHTFLKPAVKLEDSSLITQLSCSDVASDGSLNAYVSFSSDEALAKALAWSADTPILLTGPGGSGCHPDRKPYVLRASGLKPHASRTAVLSLSQSNFTTVAATGYTRLAPRSTFNGTIPVQLSKRDDRYEESGNLPFNSSKADFIIFESPVVEVGLCGSVNGSMNADFTFEWSRDSNNSLHSSFHFEGKAPETGFEMSIGVDIDARNSASMANTRSLFTTPVTAIGVPGVAEIGIAATLSASVDLKSEVAKFRIGPNFKWTNCQVDISGDNQPKRIEVRAGPQENSWIPSVDVLSEFDINGAASLAMAPTLDVAVALVAADEIFRSGFSLSASPHFTVAGSENNPEAKALCGAENRLLFQESVSGGVFLNGPLFGSNGVTLYKLPSWTVAHQCPAPSG